MYMICTSCPFCFDGVTSMLMRSEWERIQAWALFIVKAFSLRSSSTSQSLWSTNGRFNQLIRGCCVVVLWWGRKGKKSKVSQFWDNLMSCSFSRYHSSAHPKLLPPSSSPSQSFTRVTLPVAFPPVTQWRHGVLSQNNALCGCVWAVCGQRTMLGC